MSKYDGLLRKPKGHTVKTPQLQTTTAGRPRAKRSDPEYQQITCYMRRDTYVAARKRLLDEDGEFSDLVEELVSKWAGGQRKEATR